MDENGEMQYFFSNTAVNIIPTTGEVDPHAGETVLIEPEPLEDNEGEQEEETVVEETTEVVTENGEGAPAGNNEIEP
jgi:hypothetical protein